MRILVTGGAGFIGSHLVAAFAAAGHPVRVLDDLSSGRRENLPADGQRVRLVEGDIRDAETLRQAVTGIEVVLHLAAFVSVPGSVADPVTAADINVTGTVRLLDACRQADVRRLVFASSAAVYGEPRALPLAEDAPLEPTSPYGVHKLVGEHLCRVTAHTGGPDTVSFRFFNVYGPRQRADSDYAAVIPAFRARLRQGKPAVIHGDGEQTRDFVFVGDVVAAMERAVAAEASWKGAVFNLARGEATSIRELARALATAEGADDDPQLSATRAGDITHSVASTARLGEALGWSPPTSLAEGLRLSQPSY